MGKWAIPIKSPLVEYGGSVRFPPHFLPAHYRKWQEANEGLKEKEDEGVFYSKPYTDSEKPSLFHPAQWAHVLAIVESVDIENLPKEALADPTGESTPHEVMAWLIPLVVDDYIPEKLNLKN